MWQFLVLLLRLRFSARAEQEVATLTVPRVAEGQRHEGKAAVFDGEDASSAAFRVAQAQGVSEVEDMVKIAQDFKEQLQDVDYKPPKQLTLRSGGAYLKRADEMLKEKRFPEAGADCLRALLRPGLDPSATEPIRQKLEHALLRMQRIREMREQEEAQENEKYAEQKAQADALAREWKTLIQQDEQLWEGIDSRNLNESLLPPLVEDDAEEVTSLDLNLNRDDSEFSARLKLFNGEDPSHAAFHFCAANGIHSAGDVSRVIEVLNNDLNKKSKYSTPNHLAIATAAEHLEKGKFHQDSFDLAHAGAHYARGLQAKGLSDDETQDLSNRLSTVLSGYNGSRTLLSAWSSKQYQNVLDAAKKLPMAVRSDLVQLVIARSYHNTGKPKEALSAITSLLNNCDKTGDWLNDESRVIGSLVGAVLALRFGDIEKAKKVYQVVLRNDPEQALVKKRYKVLRTFMRFHSDIEELLARAKNHDAVKAVERVQRVLRDVMGEKNAAGAGTRLLLFECKAKSAMTFHDDAIEACNTAIEQFENHDNPSPTHIAEAYAWRAEANMRDNSFDDAVADLQVATTKHPGEKDYQEKLQQAKKKQADWNKAEDQKDRRGQSQGTFYVNRPIKQMLDLPDNVDELDQDEKCKRLKAAFRKMSLRWHPDKAKGGKKRAQRKSSELSEGKGLLELQWGCKGRKR